jgi:hypothetical protein
MAGADGGGDADVDADVTTPTTTGAPPLAAGNAEPASLADGAALSTPWAAAGKSTAGATMATKQAAIRGGGALASRRAPTEHSRSSRWENVLLTPFSSSPGNGVNRLDRVRVAWDATSV